MKNILSFLALAVLFSCQNSSTESTADSEFDQDQKPGFLSKYPLATWMRKSPVEIGCMLENELAFRDSIFNCAYEDYINNGDPCKNTDTYYEGPQFPDSLVSKIHSSITNISLSFEHGNLQELDISLKDSMLITDLKTIFNLPDSLPENVMSINYGENPKYTKSLALIGFEHMGEGDVDCE